MTTSRDENPVSQGTKMRRSVGDRAPATAFKAFIDTHSEEQAWLADWNGADLAADPAPGPDAPLGPRRDGSARIPDRCR